MSGQEFIFKSYFPTIGWPDIIIFRLPMKHVKNYVWKEVSQDFQYLVEVIAKWKPNQTHVYWIPTAAECEEARSKNKNAKKYVNKTYGEEHLQATPFIYKLNKYAYSILEPYLFDRKSNMHGFFNLINMSEPRCVWSLDGIHFDSNWYNKEVSIILSTICQM